MSFRRVDFVEALSGLVCLYKPPDVSLKYLVSSFARIICSDLNNLDDKTPANYLIIQPKEDSVSINIRPSYLDNNLARGPKYQPEELSLVVSPIGKITSGVCVLGVNHGISQIKKLRKYPPVKVLHIKGRLGEATRFLYKDEKVIARAKYTRLQKTTVDKVLSAFQAAHQRKIFAEFGLNIQSQEAYDLAVKGLLRPLKGDIPAVYSMKCINFQPPDFTVEIICIQDNENYLLRFIHDLGLELRTLAHCTGMRCIRCGPFSVQHSLLLKECTVENVKKNMKLCGQLMRKYFEDNSPHLRLVSENDSSSEDNNELRNTNIS